MFSTSNVPASVRSVTFLAPPQAIVPVALTSIDWLVAHDELVFTPGSQTRRLVALAGLVSVPSLSDDSIAAGCVIELTTNGLPCESANTTTCGSWPAGVAAFGL